MGGQHVQWGQGRFWSWSSTVSSYLGTGVGRMGWEEAPLGHVLDKGTGF